MGRYTVTIWSTYRRKRQTAEHSFETSLELGAIASRLIPGIRKKYPHNWITITSTHTGKVIKGHEYCPKGFDSRAKLKKEIENKGGKYIYGSIEKPHRDTEHRRGKGNKRKRKRYHRSANVSKNVAAFSDLKQRSANLSASVEKRQG